jgi:peroxiredoxin
MKNVLVYILIFIAINPSKIQAQTSKGYQINGHIEGLEDGEKLLLSLFIQGWHTTLTDSCIVKNGEFHLSGEVPDGPRLYWLINRHPRHKNKFIVLLMDNGEIINIKGTDINKMPNGGIQGFLTIEGSRSNKDFSTLFNLVKFYNPFVDLINNQLNAIGEYSEQTSKIVDAYMGVKNAVSACLIQTLRDTSYNSSIVFWLSEEKRFANAHFSFLPELYEHRTEHDKESFYGRLLKQKIPLAIGQPFPEFTLPDPEGKIVQLKDVTAKNKITIIHFWATNSEKIDSYQKELFDIYKEYHKKGLEIVDISSDTSARKWRIAVQDLPWPYHVSDLKGRNGVVENIYHEYTYPYGKPNVPNTTNVVVDANGKIIAWGATGVELEYYLSARLNEKKQ